MADRAEAKAQAEADARAKGDAATPGAAGGVLARKLAAARPAPAGAEPAGPGKALRLALARSARAVPGAEIVVERASEARRSLAELLELVPERSLLAVLGGPAEGLGLMTIALPILTGLGEMLTMCRTGTGAVADRRPTRTDAALLAPWIDTVLEGFEAEFLGRAEQIWAGGFRYATCVEDMRALGLLLEDVEYRCFTVDLSLQGGDRRGPLLLALPALGRGARSEIETEGEESPVSTAAPLIAQAVLAVPAELRAVLHRQRMAIADVTRLRVGALLPLGPEALSHVRLEGPDGKAVGLGRLGQSRGHRALRLGAPQAASPVLAPFEAGAAPLAGIGRADAAERAEEEGEAED